MKPSYDLSALERRIRQKIQGVTQTFWVVCHPGFEGTIAGEIQEILTRENENLKPSQSFVKNSVKTAFGGVEFQGKLEDCWRVNAMARTPSRISMRIDDFHATQFPELIRKIAEIPWELYLSPHAEGQIQVTSRNSKLIHTDAIEDRVAYGIQMRLGPWRDAIPADAQPHTFPQMVLVRFENDHCTISIDSSGELLFKRGFDKFTEDAPLRDTLAACILRKAGWEKCTHLIDPMAGSGTFTLEALLSRSATHLPGLVRRFAFEEWPNFRTAAYGHLLKTIAPNPDALPIESIQVLDYDYKSVQTIRSNLSALKLPPKETPNPAQQDFFLWKPVIQDAARTLVVLNPPYGVRIAQDSRNLYARIGEHLRANFQGCKYAVICPDPQEAEQLGLRSLGKAISKNGGLEIGILFGRIPTISDGT